MANCYANFNNDNYFFSDLRRLRRPQRHRHQHEEHWSEPEVRAGSSKCSNCSVMLQKVDIANDPSRPTVGIRLCFEI